MRIVYKSLFPKSLLLLVPLALLMVVCRNVDSVSPTNRTTFIKVYEKANNYEAQVAEVLPDGSGFIIGSNLSFNLGGDAYLTRTDLFGNIVGNELRLPGSSITSIKIVSDGYLVYGDGIKTNPTAIALGDRTVTRAKIFKISTDLSSIMDTVSFYAPGDSTTDFHGTGLTVDTDGTIITTGNKKASSSNSFFQAFVAAYSPTTFDTLWTRPGVLLDQDFLNSKNVFISSTGDIVWTNSVQKVNLSQTYSYLTIPTLHPESILDNYSYLGQTNTNSNKLQATEMQAGFSGYGIVGTFSDAEGKNANLFFVQANGLGQFLSETLLVFDGINIQVGSGASVLASAPASATEDQGLAISPTIDGGYLIGGTMTSNIHRGNGGLDGWLIKVDANNKYVWDKIYGGAGDDRINSIRALNDGTFIVAGGTSNTSFDNGLVSSFIMRVDANGDIKK